MRNSTLSLSGLFAHGDLGDEELDNAQAQLRERLDAEGARDGVLTAVRAVYLAATGHDPSKPHATGTGLDSAEAASRRTDPAFVDGSAASGRFAEAFAEAARFTFRPRRRRSAAAWAAIRTTAILGCLSRSVLT